MRPFMSPTRVENQRASALGRLMSEPQPGGLDGNAAGAWVAGLGYSLVTPHAAALPRARGEPEIASDLTAVVEVAKEHLLSEHAGERRADPAHPHKALGSSSLAFDLLHLLAVHFGKQFLHQLQSPTLTRDLRLEARRQSLPVGGDEGVQTPLPGASGRHEGADAVEHQQSLDAADVAGALFQQALPFAAQSPAILIGDGRNMHHAADLLLPQLQRHQRS